jgi:hypothetical protein
MAGYGRFLWQWLYNRKLLEQLGNYCVLWLLEKITCGGIIPGS